jgi:hypothetical protein
VVPVPHSPLNHLSKAFSPIRRENEHSRSTRRPLEVVYLRQNLWRYLLALKDHLRLSISIRAAIPSHHSVDRQRLLENRARNVAVPRKKNRRKEDSDSPRLGQVSRGRCISLYRRRSSLLVHSITARPEKHLEAL